MFWMMNGRNRRGVIGAVFSGLAAAFSGVVNGIVSVFSGIGSTGTLIVGIVIGLALYFHIRRRKSEAAEKE